MEIRGDEATVIAACKADFSCTGYDFRVDELRNRMDVPSNHLCHQISYPGFNKSDVYKLCKKPNGGTGAGPRHTMCTSCLNHVCTFCSSAFLASHGCICILFTRTCAPTKKCE